MFAKLATTVAAVGLITAGGIAIAQDTSSPVKTTSGSHGDGIPTGDTGECGATADAGSFGGGTSSANTSRTLGSECMERTTRTTTATAEPDPMRYQPVTQGAGTVETTQSTTTTTQPMPMEQEMPADTSTGAGSYVEAGERG